MREGCFGYGNVSGGGKGSNGIGDICRIQKENGLMVRVGTDGGVGITIAEMVVSTQERGEEKS